MKKKLEKFADSKFTLVNLEKSEYVKGGLGGPTFCETVEPDVCQSDTSDTTHCDNCYDLPSY
jgi:hypothetical protein